MENGNQLIRAALLLLAIVVLFGPFLFFPLLAGAIGQASLRWLYGPAGVLMMMTATSLWLMVVCGDFMAVRDELQVHHKRVPKGFPTTSSDEAWARVEIAISRMRYQGRSWSNAFPSRDFADASSKCVYDFDLPYRFLWLRFATQIKLTVKIKQFPAQNLALACYWFEKDRSHWWRLPPATLMKKTSVALDAVFHD